LYFSVDGSFDTIYGKSTESSQKEFNREDSEKKLRAFLQKYDPNTEMVVLFKNTVNTTVWYWLATKHAQNMMEFKENYKDSDNEFESSEEEDEK
jgi:hypothetical protein